MGCGDVYKIAEQNGGGEENKDKMEREEGRKELWIEKCPEP